MRDEKKMKPVIIVKGKRYYYYRTLNNFESAMNTARLMKMKKGAKYVIIPFIANDYMSKLFAIYFNRRIA